MDGFKSGSKINCSGMKKIFLSVLFLVLTLWPSLSQACAVCERNQPKLLRGIIHGVGPDRNVDYVIIAVVALIVLVTLFFSVKWLIRPGEKSEDHIKRMFIDQENYDR